MKEQKNYLLKRKNEVEILAKELLKREVLVSK